MGKVAIYIPESSSMINQRRKRLRSEEQESGHETEYTRSRREHRTTSENSHSYSGRGGRSRDLLAQPMSKSHLRPTRETPSKPKLEKKSQLRERTVIRPNGPPAAHEEAAPACPSPGVSLTTSASRTMTSGEVSLNHDPSFLHVVSSSQLNLTYRGYTLTYDMACLPDNPAVPLALLAVTESDPGAYLIISAHYRRTGRSGAARSILLALLDKHKDESGAQKGNERPRSSKCAKPTLNLSVIRPALLMLAACELDISHESPTNTESNSHASTAHELFRAVYGSTGGPTRTSYAESRAPLDPILGDSRPSSHVRQSNDSAAGDSFILVEGIDPVALERNCVLEKRLQEARGCHGQLIDGCTTAHDRLASARTKFKLLEAPYAETLHLPAGKQDKQVMEGGKGGRKGLWGTLRTILS